MEHIWQYIATTCVGIILTGIGFWFTFAQKCISKDEVMELLENHSPYLQDRQFIMERLAVNKETQAALSSALQRNTEVMNELKIQIATLGKTLEAIENRIESQL